MSSNSSSKLKSPKNQQQQQQQQQQQPQQQQNLYANQQLLIEKNSKEFENLIDKIYAKVLDLAKEKTIHIINSDAKIVSRSGSAADFYSSDSFYELAKDELETESTLNNATNNQNHNINNNNEPTSTLNLDNYENYYKEFLIQNEQHNLNNMNNNENVFNIMKHTCLVCCKSYEQAKWLRRHFILEHIIYKPTYKCLTCRSSSTNVSVNNSGDAGGTNKDNDSDDLLFLLDEYIIHLLTTHNNLNNLNYLYDLFMLKYTQDVLIEFYTSGEFYLDPKHIKHINKLKYGKENMGLVQKLHSKIFENFFINDNDTHSKCKSSITLTSRSIKSNLIYTQHTKLQLFKQIIDYYQTELSLLTASLNDEARKAIKAANSCFSNGQSIDTSAPASSSSSLSNESKFNQCKFCLKLFTDCNAYKLHLMDAHTFSEVCNKCIVCPYCRQLLKSSHLKQNMIDLLNCHILTSNCLALNVDAMPVFNGFEQFIQPQSIHYLNEKKIVLPLDRDVDGDHGDGSGDGDIEIKLKKSPKRKCDDNDHEDDDDERRRQQQQISLEPTTTKMPVDDSDDRHEQIQIDKDDESDKLKLPLKNNNKQQQQPALVMAHQNGYTNGLASHHHHEESIKKIRLENNTINCNDDEDDYENDLYFDENDYEYNTSNHHTNNNNNNNNNGSSGNNSSSNNNTKDDFDGETSTTCYLCDQKLLDTLNEDSSFPNSARLINNNNDNNDSSEKNLGILMKKHLNEQHLIEKCILCKQEDVDVKQIHEHYLNKHFNKQFNSFYCQLCTNESNSTTTTTTTTNVSMFRHSWSLIEHVSCVHKSELDNFKRTNERYWKCHKCNKSLKRDKESVERHSIKECERSSSNLNETTTTTTTKTINDANNENVKTS